MANGNTAIEGLYNGAAFVFNEEELKGIEAKATTCLSSQYEKVRLITQCEKAADI